MKISQKIGQLVLDKEHPKKLAHTCSTLSLQGYFFAITSWKSLL